MSIVCISRTGAYLSLDVYRILVQMRIDELEKTKQIQVRV